MLDTNMDETSTPRPPRASDSLSFDGSVLDLERVLAHVQLQFLLYPDAFEEGSTKSAYLYAHFRGAALDWVASQLGTERGMNNMQSYDTALRSVKSAFGYDDVQVQAIAQTRLGVLKQSGDLLEFLLEFDSLTARARTTADATRLTLLLPKLNKFYHDALVTNGDTLSNYSTVRSQLLNIYSRAQLQEKAPDTLRAAARCKKCGKRGHTAIQCVAKN